ncbi:MAG: hypothetical protein M3280_00615 [Actinomycetota bacterium]|nr:hypothetical protein [Actinomycetota bacterium]
MNDSGVVLNWLVKLILGLAIGGVVLFDAGSIVVNFFGLDSDADEVANLVATDIAGGNLPESDLNAIEQCPKNPSLNDTCRQLHRRARKKSAKLTEAHVDAKGNLKITLERTADTLIVEKIGPIEDWGEQSAEGRASINPS